MRDSLTLAVVAVLLAALSVTAVLVVRSNGWTLYYGDAESHMDIGRRVIDSRTPGYDQIGTVWLPLPHALMLPLVKDDNLWRSGLAGAIPSALCFGLSGLFLFAAARKIFDSAAAGFAALAVYAFNPNLLYLAGTPMTEPVFLACLTGLVYAMSSYRRTLSWRSIIAAGLASIAASLTRYEGWFLIPFAALFFFAVGGRKRWVATLLFGCIASLAPLYWLAHNYYYFGDALAFYHGPYSAKAYYQTALAHGMQRYAGDHDWAKALLYYRTAAQLCAGTVAIILGGIGFAVAVWKRVWWPVAFLALPPVFYVWSMYSSGTPIFVPGLWPFSYYNTRYGLAVLPGLALGAGAIVFACRVRYRPHAASILIAAALGQWIAHSQPEQWVCWKESLVNSEARRAWTDQAAQYMGQHYRRGTGIFSSLGDLAGIYREAGIPLREVLQEGNGAAWDAALARTEFFLHEEWAVAIAGDKVATAVQKASRTGPHYTVLDTIIVKNAPVIEIYKRD